MLNPAKSTFSSSKSHGVLWKIVHPIPSVASTASQLKPTNLGDEIHQKIGPHGPHFCSSLYPLSCIDFLSNSKKNSEKTSDSMVNPILLVISCYISHYTRSIHHYVHGLHLLMVETSEMSNLHFSWLNPNIKINL